MTRASTEEGNDGLVAQPQPRKPQALVEVRAEEQQMTSSDNGLRVLLARVKVPVERLIGNWQM